MGELTQGRRVPPYPLLHVICGLPGSGKTTFAEQLERDLPALRLMPQPHDYYPRR
jgi:adenylylsulfate kinase-like enzyme